MKEEPNHKTGEAEKNYDHAIDELKQSMTEAKWMLALILFIEVVEALKALSLI